VFKAEERQTTVHSWGLMSEMLYSSADEKYLGFGDLVQFSRIRFYPGYSSTPMILLRNLEVIDIILTGSAGYQDGTGANAAYPENTLQIVSAGKGIYRSEFNPSHDVPLEKLQIGILPNRLNADPVGTKALFDLDAHRNSLVTLVSPHADESALSIRQQAAVLMGKFDAGKQIVYDVSGSSTGLFLFVVSGIVTVGDHQLHQNDSIGIKSSGKIAVTFAEESVLLILELEMPREENT
jgi:redox-sensitive bicupin YhaK (pirin superfamily)